MIVKRSVFISTNPKIIILLFSLCIMVLLSQKSVYAAEDHLDTPMFSSSLNAAIKEFDTKDNLQNNVSKSIEKPAAIEKTKTQVAYSNVTFSYTCKAWPTCAFTCSTMATCSTTCSLSSCDSKPQEPETPDEPQVDTSDTENITDNDTQGVQNAEPNAEPNEITVVINENKVEFDVKPVVENGRTLVPLRKIFEVLGAKVDWDDATQTVKGVKGNITISLVVNSVEANVNGAVKTLDVPAKIISGRLLVPARFISESLGAKVEWDESTRTIYIKSEQSPSQTSTQMPASESEVSGMNDGLAYYNPSNSSFAATKDSSNTFGGAVALVRTNFDDVYKNNNRDSIFNIDKQFSKLTTSIIFTSEKEDSIDITFYDVDTRMELKKLTLNKDEQYKNISVDVSGIKNLGIRLNNIQNPDTKKGYDVLYNNYPKNTLTLIDPVLSK